MLEYIDGTIEDQLHEELTEIERQLSIANDLSKVDALFELLEQYHIDDFQSVRDRAAEIVATY